MAIIIEDVQKNNYVKKVKDISQDGGDIQNNDNSVILWDGGDIDDDEEEDE